MTGSLRDRKDWITGTTKVQTALHTNMYLPNHEDRDRHRATGEVFVYAKPLRTTGWRNGECPNLFDGFSLRAKPGFPTAWRKLYDQESREFIRYEGLSISDGWQQRLSETFFDRFLMRKTWTLRLRKECRQRVWLMIRRVETQRTAW